MWVEIMNPLYNKYRPNHLAKMIWVFGMTTGHHDLHHIEKFMVSSHQTFGAHK